MTDVTIWWPSGHTELIQGAVERIGDEFVVRVGEEA